LDSILSALARGCSPTRYVAHKKLTSSPSPSAAAAAAQQQQQQQQQQLQEQHQSINII
jgi:hypothetical protein